MGIYMAIGNVDCWKVGNEVVSVKSPKKKRRSTAKIIAKKKNTFNGKKRPQWVARVWRIWRLTMAENLVLILPMPPMSIPQSIPVNHVWIPFPKRRVNKKSDETALLSPSFMEPTVFFAPVVKTPEFKKYVVGSAMTPVIAKRSCESDGPKLNETPVIAKKSRNRESRNGESRNGPEVSLDSSFKFYKNNVRPMVFKPPKFACDELPCSPSDFKRLIKKGVPEEFIYSFG